MPTRTIHRQTLHLLDPRPPQALQAQLERSTQAVFAPLQAREAAAGLARRADLASGSLHHRLTLHLVDVLPQGHSYRLEVEATSDDAQAELAVLRRQSEAWIGLWTDGLDVRRKPPAGTGSAPRRQAAAEVWHAGEAVLGDVAAVQQTILQALRDGATFSTAHKEGGALIRFDGQGYECAEHGDNPSRRVFASDAEFLPFLRSFFECQGARQGGLSGLPEADAWRLILRRLEPARTSAVAGGVAQGPAGATARMGPLTIAAVVVVMALAGGLAYLKYGAKADALRAGPPGPRLERVHALPAVPEQKDWQRLQAEHQRGVEAAKAAARGASR